MSKICISKCVNDARVPVRATFVNLYKWPESDAEFMKSAAMHGGGRQNSRVANSISCRQTYLKSYTFSREETVHERTIKCFGRVRGRMAAGRKEALLRRRRRVKEFSRAALLAIFRRLLFCTTKVDVANAAL